MRFLGDRFADRSPRREAARRAPNADNFSIEILGSIWGRGVARSVASTRWAPQSYHTAEAVSAFRDIFSMSVVPYARTRRLRFDRPDELVFTNAFQFYPWMLDGRFEDMILINPAQMHAHLLAPGRNRACRGRRSYSSRRSKARRKNRAWRSFWRLNSLGLTRAIVSNGMRRGVPGARSISTPAKRSSPSGPPSASSLGCLFSPSTRSSPSGSSHRICDEDVRKQDRGVEVEKGLRDRLQRRFRRELRRRMRDDTVRPSPATPEFHGQSFPEGGQTPRQTQLATWVCRKVYDLRNDFLHGNDVAAWSFAPEQQAGNRFCRLPLSAGSHWLP